MLQLGGEIEEAGIIMGIPWWKRMVRIIMPIQKTSILSGYLLPYISCMRELSLFILLISPSSAVLTTMLFQYNEKGWNQYANAINLLIVLVVLLFFAHLPLPSIIIAICCGTLIKIFLL